MRFAALTRMKTTLISLSIALALGTLAACDRNANTPKQTGATPPSSSTPSAPAGSGSSATPAQPAPSSSAKSDGTQPPAQGQVDAKQPEQQKDFQHKGDGAGPKPGG